MDDQSPVPLIKVNDGTTTTTLASLPNSWMYSVSGGFVVYRDANKMYAWDKTHGSHVLLDTNTGSVVQRGNTAFVRLGRRSNVVDHKASAIYRVPLQ